MIFMIQKRIIIIDDAWDEDDRPAIEQQLSIQGLKIELVAINPNDEKFIIENADEELIDERLVLEEIRRQILAKQTDLIACDYTLGDSLDAILLLHAIRQHYHFKGTIILFSGNIEKVIRDILLDDSTRIENLKKLIRANISEFPKRGLHYDVIKGHINKNSEFDIDLEILLWLQRFPEIELDIIGYERKTCQDIFNAIEKNSVNGVDFKKQLIEQGFSSLVNVLTQQIENHE